MKKMGKQANICAYVGFTLTLVLAMVGIFAFGLGSHTRTRADSVEAATSGDWTYTVASNKATITAYSGTATDLTIPSTLGGYSVTVIGTSNASASFITNARTTVTTVRIPSSVITISQNAFLSCSALTSVVYVDGTGANLTTISSYAFRLCTALVNMRLPDGLKTLGAGSFHGCNKLANVTFPCKNADAASSQKDISWGWGPFTGCTSLSAFSVTTPASGIKPYYAVDENGILFSNTYSNNVATKTTLVRVPRAFKGDANNSYTVPSYVQVLNGSSFLGSALKVVKFNGDSQLNFNKLNSIAGVGGSSIQRYEVVGSTSRLFIDNDCLCGIDNGKTYLLLYPSAKTDTSFVVKSSVDVVGTAFFSGASRLKSVTLENGVSELKDMAFWKSGITGIHFPASLRTITTNTFYQTELATITVDPANPYYKSVNNSLLSKDGKILYLIPRQGVTNYIVPDGVTTIWGDACAAQDQNHIAIESVTIPASVTSINYTSFQSCTVLSQVNFLHTTVPADLSIGGQAFSNCPVLQVNLQNRNVYNYFKSHFTTSQFTNAPSCFNCLDYTVTLTLNNNGDTNTKLYSWGNGSNYSMYSNANHTTSASSVTVPTRAGYTFDGYWLDSDGDSTQYITKTGAFVSGIADIDADSTLYAHWIPATPLLWSTLGGAAKIYPVDSETGMVRAEVTEAYAGYTFAGWRLNDGTNISSYTVEGGNPKKVVDIPASVLNGKILIASFKQNNTVVDTYANTTHNYLVATTNGGYARILGENASATAVRIRAQTTDPDYKFSHWTLTNLGTGEVTKLLNGMPLTETEDYVSFNCVVPLSMLDGKILTAVFKMTKPSNVNLTINYIPATLPAQSTFSTYIDNTVTAVVFDWFTDDLARSYLVNGTNVISGLTAVNVSTNEFPIYKYLNNSNHTLYFLTMSDVHIVATSNITFDGKSTLTSIIFKNFDTSLMTGMGSMFRNCSALTSLDLSCFDTSNVTNMSSMFYYCDALASLDVSSFNTSKVTTMYSMFMSCDLLTYIDVSGFDTSSVTTMQNMFNGCSGLVSLDVSGFNTGNVTSLQSMFQTCQALKVIDVSGFDTAKVTSMQDMFLNCNNVISLDLSGFNTSNVTNIAGMFNGCNALSSLDLSSFDTSKVEYMHYLFCNCKNLISIDISSFNTAKCIRMDLMFYHCDSLTSLNLSNFNTTKCTTTVNMFNSCCNLTSLDVSSFDTSVVTNMQSMFSNCDKLTSITFGSNFKTSKVTIMHHMFNNCKLLTTLDLSTFTTTALTDLESMFANCYVLETIYVSSSWNHSLTSANTFAGCTSLKGWYQNGTALASNDFNSQNISAAYAKIAASGNGCYLTNSNLKSTLESLRSGMLITGAEFNELLPRSESGGGEIIAYSIAQSSLGNKTAYASTVSGTRGAKLADLQQEVYPEYIVFGNKTTYASAVSGVTGIDVTAYNTGQVKLYLVGTVAFILHETDGTIYANPDCSNMFYYLTSVKSIIFENFDTWLMTNMEQMFQGTNSIEQLDLSGFDMSHVTNISNAFVGCGAYVIYVAEDLTLNVNYWNSPFDNSTGPYAFYLDNNQLEIKGYNADIDSNNHACIAASGNDGALTSVAIKSQVEALLNNCIGSLSLNSNTTSVIFGTKTAYSSAVGNTTGIDVSFLGNGNIKCYYVGTTTYILNENNQTTYCLNAYGLFSNKNRLTNITWGNFDTRYTTNMKGMFSGCIALTSLDLSSFNTKNTLIMSNMFEICTGLITLDLSSFVSNELTYTSYMFYRCTNLTEVTFGANFTCNKVIAAACMFKDCTNLVSPGLENFVLGQLKHMGLMFNNCTSLVSLDLGHFTPNALIDMDSAFVGCTNLGAIFVPSGWNLNLTTSRDVFNNCNNLVGYYPSGNTFGQYAYDSAYKTSTYAVLPTSGVRGYLTDVQYKNDILVKFPNMIISGQELNVLIKGGTATYSTDNIRFTKIVFGHKEDYTTEVSGTAGIDVSFYQNGNIKLYRVGATAYILHEKNGTILASDCYNMFYGFSKVTDIILDHFDTSQVTDMRQMFYKCSSLTILDLSGFDMSNVTSDKISDMFNECTNLIIIYSANDWTLTYKNSYTHPFDSNNASLRGYYLNNNTLAAYCYSSFNYTYAKVATSTKTGYFTNIALKSQVEAQNILLPGEQLNLVLKGEGVTSYTTNDYTISKIIFGNKSTYSGAVNGVTGVDVSLFHNNRVKLYKVGSVAYILSENGDTIYASNCGSMLAYLPALVDVVFANFNTSKCASFLWMFDHDSSLPSLDLSGFNTTNIKKIACMFNDCAKLSVIFVASSFVNNASLTGATCFNSCNNLHGYYLKNNTVKYNSFNSSNVSEYYVNIATESNGSYLTDVALKPYLADYLVTGVELNALIKGQAYDSEDQTVTKVVFGNKNTYSTAVTNTTGVDVTQNKNGNIKLYRVGSVIYILHENNRPIYATSLEYTFYRFSALEEINFGTLNTSQVYNMNYMFAYSTALKTLDLSGFDVSSETKLGYTFYGCVNLETVYVAATWSAGTGNNTYTFGIASSNTTKLCGWYSDSGILKMNGFDSNNVSSAYAKIANSTNGAYFTLSSLKSQIEAAKADMLIDGISFNELVKGTTYNAAGDSTITKVVFGNKNTYSGVVNGVTGEDVTVGQTGHVKLYRVGTEIYVLSETNSTIFANHDCSYMFNTLQAMREVVFSNFDTSRVSSMYNMFDYNNALTKLDVSMFDTSNVTDMQYMFYGCSGISSLDISSFDNSKVSSISYMFNGTSSLVTIFASNKWSKSLSGSSVFATGTLRGFYLNGNTLASYIATSSAGNYAQVATDSITGYFTDVSVKPYIDNYLPSGNTLNMLIKDSSKTTVENNSFTKIVFGNKSTYSSSVAGVTGQDISLTENGKVKLYKVGDCAYILSENGGTLFATNCSYMFHNFKALTEIVFDNFDTSNCTSLSYMFYRCTALLTLDLSGFDTSNVTSMYSFCQTCSSLTSLDLSSFDISKLNNLGYAFSDCSSLGVIFVNENWNYNLSDTGTFSGSTVLKGYYELSSTLYSNNYDANNTKATYAKIAASGNGCYLTNVNIKSYLGNYLLGGKALNSAIKGGLSYSSYDTTTTHIIVANKSSYSSAVSGVSGVDVSVTGNGQIKLYRVGSKVYILSENNTTIYPTDCSYMFGYFKNLIGIVLENFSHTKISSMGYMFYSCSKLSAIFVPSAWSTSLSNTNCFDSSNYIFGFYSDGGNIAINQTSSGSTTASDARFPTSSTSGKFTSISLKAQVANCLPFGLVLNAIIKGGDAVYSSSDNTTTKIIFGNKTTYSASVAGVVGEDISLTGDNTIKLYRVGTEVYILNENNATIYATHCNYMFYGFHVATCIVPNFDTLLVKWMRSMFNSCYLLTSVDISTFDFTNVTGSFINNFDGCYSLGAIFASKNYSGSSVTAFNNCSGLYGFYLQGGNLAYRTGSKRSDAAKIASSSVDGYFTDVTLKSQLANYLISGKALNVLIKRLNGEVPSTSDEVQDRVISSIIFGNKSTYSSAVSGVTGMDVSLSQSGNIMLYQVGSTIYILSENNSTIYASNCEYMFKNFVILNNVVFNNFDTSQVTNMQYMFNSCSCITSLDISGFDTSRVTNLLWFAGNTSAKVVYVSSLWNKSAVSSNSSAFPNTVKGYYVNNNNELLSYNYSSTFNTYARIATTSTNGYLTDVAIKSRVEAALTPNPDMLLGGTTLNAIIKDTDFSSTINYTVTKVVFGNKSTYSSIVNGITGMDVTQEQSGRVKLYRVGTQVYILHETGGTIYAPTSCYQIFWNIKGMREIVFDNFDTSLVTKMGDMFYGNPSLASLDLSGFNTSSVTDIQSMFERCTGLVSLDLSNFNLTSLSSNLVSDLFYGCTNLRVIYTSSDWNLSSNSTDVFKNCPELRGYYLNGNTLAYNAWDENATNDGTYAKLATSSNGCYFTNATLKSRITLPTATDNHILSGTALKQYFNTDETITRLVFANKSAYSTAVNGVTGVDMSVSMNGKIKMYKSNGTAYFLHETNSTIYALDCASMFSGLNYVTDIVFENFNTSKATDMLQMFSSSKMLKSLDLSGFDTSKVTRFYQMFMDSNNLVSINLAGFDLSSATDLDSMFNKCTNLQFVFASSSWQNSLTGSTSFPTFESCSKLKGYYLDANDKLKFNAYNSSRKTAAYAHIAGDGNDYYLTDVSLKSTLENFIIDGQSLNKLIKGITSYTADDNVITQIVFGNKSTYSTIVAGVTGEDVTISNSGKVKLYRVGSSAYILSENGTTIYATDCSYMIAYFKALEDIVFDNFDTSQVANMSNMFCYSGSLAKLDLSGFDTTNVTNIAYMFDHCSSISSFDLSNFDVTNVTSMLSSMFSYCSNLTVIFANATWNKSFSGSGTFSQDSNLKGWYLDGNDNLAYNSFITSNNTSGYANIAASGNNYYLTDGSLKSRLSNFLKSGQSFAKLLKNNSSYNSDDYTITRIVFGNKSAYSTAVSGVTGVDVSLIDGGNIKLYRVGTVAYILNETNSTIYALDCSSMFNYLKTVTSIVLDNFDISYVTNMASMFLSCSNLSVIFANTWSHSLTNSATFDGCSNLKGYYLDSNDNLAFNAYIVTPSNKTADYAHLAASGNNCYLTDKNLKPYFANALIDGKLLNPIIKGVKTLSATAYQTDDYSITKIVFANKTAYSSIVNGVTGEDVSLLGDNSIKLYKVKSTVYILSENNTTMYSLDCSYMFYEFYALEEIVFTNFDTSKASSMYSMFYLCNKLYSLDISGFDTSNVTNMSVMFYNCSRLANLDFSSFDTSKVTNMSSMFGYCESLRRLDLSSFNTANVTSMSNMFDHCSSLTSLDLTSFDTAKVTDMTQMLSYCSQLTILDLSSFSSASLTNVTNMFRYSSSLRIIYATPSTWGTPPNSDRTFDGVSVIAGYYLNNNGVLSSYNYGGNYTTGQYARVATTANRGYFTDVSLRSLVE